MPRGRALRRRHGPYRRQEAATAAARRGGRGRPPAGAPALLRAHPPRRPHHRASIIPLARERRHPSRRGHRLVGRGGAAPSAAAATDPTAAPTTDPSAAPTTAARAAERRGEREPDRRRPRVAPCMLRQRPPRPPHHRAGVLPLTHRCRRPPFRGGRLVRGAVPGARHGASARCCPPCLWCFRAPPFAITRSGIATVLAPSPPSSLSPQRRSGGREAPRERCAANARCLTRPRRCGAGAAAPPSTRTQPTAPSPPPRRRSRSPLCPRPCPAIGQQGRRRAKGPPPFLRGRLPRPDDRPAAGGATRPYFFAPNDVTAAGAGRGGRSDDGSERGRRRTALRRIRPAPARPRAPGPPTRRPRAPPTVGRSRSASSPQRSGCVAKSPATTSGSGWVWTRYVRARRRRAAAAVRAGAQRKDRSRRTAR
jgi:hypothetical protein